MLCHLKIGNIEFETPATDALSRYNEAELREIEKDRGRERENCDRKLLSDRW